MSKACARYGQGYLPVGGREAREPSSSEPRGVTCFGFRHDVSGVNPSPPRDLLYSGAGRRMLPKRPRVCQSPCSSLMLRCGEQRGRAPGICARTQPCWKSEPGADRGVC